VGEQAEAVKTGPHVEGVVEEGIIVCAAPQRNTTKSTVTITSPFFMPTPSQSPFRHEHQRIPPGKGSNIPARYAEDISTSVHQEVQKI
jgi:hypothetical protein